MKKGNALNIILFTAMFVILSCIHIFWGIDKEPFANAVTKAAPIVLLIFGVLSSGHKVPLVVLALIFSLCGDVISEMRLPGETGFLSQIVFFMFAQICYILAFAKYHSRMKTAQQSNVQLSVVPIFCGIYALCVIGMAISAGINHKRHRLLYICGGILFIISDGIIGYGSFFGRIPHSGIIIMATYYLAQYCLNIALLLDSKTRIIESANNS